MTNFVFIKDLNTNKKMFINMNQIVKIEEPTRISDLTINVKSKITLIDGSIINTDVDILSWKEIFN